MLIKTNEARPLKSVSHMSRLLFHPKIKTEKMTELFSLKKMKPVLYYILHVTLFHGNCVAYVSYCKKNIC